MSKRNLRFMQYSKPQKFSAIKCTTCEFMHEKQPDVPRVEQFRCTAYVHIPKPKPNWEYI